MQFSEESSDFLFLCFSEVRVFLVESGALSCSTVTTTTTANTYIIHINTDTDTNDDGSANSNFHTQTIIATNAHK